VGIAPGIEMMREDDQDEGPEPLTAEEKRAIASLKRLAKRWPKSLWLFSDGVNLNIMKTNRKGAVVFRRDRPYSNDLVDRRYVVAEVVGILSDGGDG
jgi:hypothetical protein